MNIRLGSLPAMVYLDSMAHSVPHELDFIAEAEMASQMGPWDPFLILCHNSSSLTDRTDMSQRSDRFSRSLNSLNLHPVPP